MKSAWPVAAMLMLTGCTVVTADMEAGTVTVTTFATSRQNIDIGQDADGSIHWRAASSEPDAMLPEALLTMIKVAAKVTGVPVQ
jgi:hypothetical protein